MDEKEIAGMVVDYIGGGFNAEVVGKLQALVDLKEIKHYIVTADSIEIETNDGYVYSTIKKEKE
jgi:hypothetical protein